MQGLQSAPQTPSLKCVQKYYALICVGLIEISAWITCFDYEYWLWESKGLCQGVGWLKRLQEGLSYTDSLKMLCATKPFHLFKAILLKMCAQSQADFWRFHIWKGVGYWWNGLTCLHGWVESFAESVLKPYCQSSWTCSIWALKCSVSPNTEWKGRLFY